MANTKIELAQKVLPHDDRPTAGTVLDDLKERVSSPFIFSYLIAFIFANWKIWIGLLYYDQSLLVSLGYKSLVDYIYRETSVETIFVLPLISALLYCFAYPVLRNFVKVTQAKFNTEVNKKINKIAGEGTVPTKRLIALRYLYEEQIRHATSILETDSSKKIEGLNHKNLELEKQITSLRGKIDHWTRFNDPQIIEGSWSVEIKNERMNVSVSGQGVYIRSAHTKYKVYEITVFHCHPEVRAMSFFLEAVAVSAGIKPTFHIHGLHTLEFDSVDELTGVIKGGSEITWKRINDPGSEFTFRFKNEELTP